MENKQIEEMANEIYETLMLEADCPLSGMDCAIIADLLVGKGYRKASEVAREIFEEISKASINWGCYCITTSKAGFLTSDVNRTLAELKKKYTEDTE